MEAMNKVFRKRKQKSQVKEEVPRLDFQSEMQNALVNIHTANPKSVISLAKKKPMRSASFGVNTSKKIAKNEMSNLIDDKKIEDYTQKIREDIGDMLGIKSSKPDPFYALPGPIDWMEKSKAIQNFRHLRNGINLSTNPKVPLKKKKFG